ncbi:unnamed protein product [Colias eurytheme]|nr:unnamed protein product [Colias eurytheme]
MVPFRMKMSQHVWPVLTATNSGKFSGWAKRVNDHYCLTNGTATSSHPATNKKAIAINLLRLYWQQIAQLCVKCSLCRAQRPGDIPPPAPRSPSRARPGHRLTLYWVNIDDCILHIN